MIGFLKGTLFRVSPQLLLVDVQGVGYEVHIPLSTYYEVQRLQSGATASFHIHTHVREDALLLFGFWTEIERQMFEKLIAVSGIGPKLAQTILSGMASEELVAAIAQGDIKRLSSIPGIGKKTAQRMVVDLKDKVRELDTGDFASQVATPAEEDLALALVNLGYKRSVADKAIAQTVQEMPDHPFAEQLKATLRRLSRV